VACGVACKECVCVNEGRHDLPVLSFFFSSSFYLPHLFLCVCVRESGVSAHALTIFTFTILFMLIDCNFLCGKNVGLLCHFLLFASRGVCVCFGGKRYQRCGTEHWGPTTFFFFFVDRRPGEFTFVQKGENFFQMCAFFLCLGFFESVFLAVCFA